MTTTTTGLQDSAVECDFEIDTCNWKNVNEEEASMKWILDTGHVADHTTGTVNGKFISADFNKSQLQITIFCDKIVIIELYIWLICAKPRAALLTML